MAPHIFAYLDDIIIAMKTFEEHMHWLRRVFNVIQEAGLTINKKKRVLRRRGEITGIHPRQKWIEFRSGKGSPDKRIPYPQNDPSFKTLSGNGVVV